MALMATLVTFHAHPDDEAIATGGVMALAKAEGHRVVLVLATKGELGEVPDGFLAPGEALADRRAAEARRAAAILGVDRVEFLGYRDSGMDGAPTNGDAAAFSAADVDEAAARLATILSDERADVLTVYDERGNYGHPDHVQVHRVGHRAALLAATPQVFEATQNRDHLVRLLRDSTDAPPLPDVGGQPPDDLLDNLGVREWELTTCVDVRSFVSRKREAMAAHESQIGEHSFFLQMPEPLFREVFGLEFFVRRGAEPGIREWSLFEHLA
jgi:LmbE family N-acetylglucosaminyl deacetylase